MSVREFDLIDRYFSGLTRNDAGVQCGIGDDAAILDVDAGEELIVSVDTLVAGTHFFPFTDPFDIGYKSLAVNLSDIAAMGAVPRWATLALTLPTADSDWLQAFASGFGEIAVEYGVALVGGDTTRGPLSITVQIMATTKQGQAIRRSGARSGDRVYVSGCLGGAGLACKALQANAALDTIPAECLARLNRPGPRVALGRELVGLASAAIDISDGLAADLAHILDASGVGATLVSADLPLCAAVQALDSEAERWQLALGAGDDYELCFTLPAASEAELIALGARLDCPLRCIGTITMDTGIRWLGQDGREVQIVTDGYRHF